MFLAQVTFFGPDQGGRQTPPQSGYHPQLQLGAIMTSCVIESVDGTTVFQFGHPYEVLLRLLFPHEYAHLIHVGMDVRLFEGAKWIGGGVIRTQVEP